MGIARLTWGLLLILGVVTLTGATTGMWIGTVSAEDHGDETLKRRVRELQAANERLQAELTALRGVLQSEQDGRAQDVLRLESQLQAAREQSQRVATRMTMAENELAKVRADASARERYLLAFFLRVGAPALSVLSEELRAHPKESGRWIFPLLEQMVDGEATSAIALLEGLAGDEALQKNGVAARARQALEIVRGR